MKIIRLKGGLGNQLFQYALGIYIETKLGQQVRFDTSWFDITHKKNTPRNLELLKLVDNFGGSIAPRSQVADKRWFLFLSESRNEFLDFVSTGLNKKFNRGYLLENPEREYNDEDLQSADYLDGYWQTSKYALGAIDGLKLVLQRKKYMDWLMRTLNFNMPTADSVCVHIRRGDYISNAGANGFHGVCSLDYYEQAKLRFDNKLGKPRYFFFSDDIEWARKSFSHWDNTLFVDVPTVQDKDVLEFCYMSSFENYVIANSTYSWWAALISNAKEVIAPIKWFTNTPVKSLYLDNWETL